jgi:D-lactate dehydrogenase
MKPVIALYDVHPRDKAALKQALGADYELVISEDPLALDSAGLAAHAAVISIHVTSPVTAEILKHLPQLRHIACRTTGYDHVDLEAAKARGITVSNVPAYGEATVAEYTFLLLLAVSRQLMRSAHSVHARVVTPDKLTGHDLAGRTLGLIGTGRIGRHVAQIARGFGLAVLAYDPQPNEAATELGYRYVPLPELYAQADAITLHAPATPETHHLLDAQAFAAMKPGVIIVNTARGSLIDTPALIAALESGKVGGAGLDVLEGEENLEFANELHLLNVKQLGDEARQVLGIDILHKMPNVLITAHNAYNSAEALERIRATTVANIRAALSGRPQNLVSQS